MKKRFCFVANSSSSSFVVAFPYIPHSEEEVAALLFQRYTPGGYPVKQVSETVFRDILGKMPLSEEEIFKEIRGKYAYLSDWEEQNPSPEWPSSSASEEERKAFRKKYDAYRKKEEKERQRLTKIATDKFLKENKDAVFFSFSYSDNDGDYWSSMEHDGTFDELPHVHISHH